MVNLAGAAAGAAVGWFVTRGLSQAADSPESDSDSNETETMPPIDESPQQPAQDVQSQLQALYGIERVNRPGQDAIEGWVGTSIDDLSAGGSAKVVITPTRGNILKVERLEFTRKDDHSYTFEIGGTTVSEGHKFVSKPPRKVTNGKTTVCVVENNSGSATDLDFEAQTWGHATLQGRGLR